MKLMWKDVWPVWWSIIWRCTLYGAIGGAVFGALGGGIAGATGYLYKARLVGAIFGYIAGITLSTLAVKQALEKHASNLTEALAVSK